MTPDRSRKPEAMIFIPLAFILLFLIACGASATATPAPGATLAPQPAATVQPAGTPQPTAIPRATLAPTATPKPTAAPPAAAKPSGSLRIAYTEIGPPMFTPKNSGFPTNAILSTNIFETGWRASTTGEMEPWLIKKWSISPDSLTWTLRLQEGVPFHKGWGQFTAEDLKWNIENMMAEGTINQNVSLFREVYVKDGYIRVVDDHTLEVNTGKKPSFALPWTMWSFGSSQGLNVTSKKYHDTVGEQKATLEGIGTGPWEFVEFRTGELFRMKAVLGHWRKTPNFAELVLLEIPEVSTRVANFQAGQLDSMPLNPESLPAVENVSGVKFMRFPGAAMVWLNIHGQNYIDRKGVPPRDTSLPWVSSNPDPSSAEWERARKVREAMSIAINREALVNSLLLGEGKPAHIIWWQGHDARLGYLKDLKYEYNVDRARRLLAEAGYGAGFAFEVDMALTLMPVPAIREAGEAVCVMWEKINIRCKQQILPMTSFRPNFVNRTGRGVNTHGVGTTQEPSRTYNSVVNSKGLINYGMEHPKLDEMVARVMDTFDTEQRWERLRELAKWIFDNTVHLPLMQANFIYPLGARIDPWPLQCCFLAFLNNFDLVPHRK